jgi:FAD:protein FMN transferase
MRRWTGATWLLPFLFVLAACSGEPEVWRFEGATMGTSYHVTVVEPPPPVAQAVVQSAIERELEQVNARMSTYRADSEVSRFNRVEAGSWFEVSPQTAEVVSAALAFHALSGGAFDITVGPLVDLWGFGAGSVEHGRVPDPDSIAAAAANTGSAAIAVRHQPPAISKSAPREIDLSAIAKGYGVDRVALSLQELGLQNYMVEVGGEVRTAGRNPQGNSWRIGIESPELLHGNVAKAIQISGESLATSGDYRNFFESAGKRFSHTIDPRTASPVSHDLVSVSVVATDCMTADALATAINVLGPDEGMALAERESIAVYMLVRAADGVQARSSRAFARYME